MHRSHILLTILIPSVCLAGIVVDQFGYRTDAAKIALARNPRIGFDTAQSHAPGTRWCLVDSATSDTVLSGTFSAWNAGAVDPASGDQVWSADFSTWKRTGTYTLVDPLAKVSSPRFRIEPDPYRTVLRHAMRTFFYERAGQEKLAIHAGAAWADDIDHLKPGQDSEARRFLDKSDATTARDLHGGWFQNSTTNKYTAIAGLTVSALLKAYDENPRPWTDDLDLPESGNGIPDMVPAFRSSCPTIPEMPLHPRRPAQAFTGMQAPPRPYAVPRRLPWPPAFSPQPTPDMRSLPIA